MADNVAATADSSDSFDNDSDSFDGSPEPKSSDAFDDDSFETPKEKEAKASKPDAKAAPKTEASADAKPEPKKVEKFHSVTINGKEVRVTESQLIAQYQKQEAAEEKFQQASNIEKQTRAFFDALQKNPREVLNDPRLPIDRQALALEWLKAQVEEELTDPKDLKLSETERRLKAYEDRDLQEQERVAQEAHQKEHQATVQKIQKNLSETFTKAMELSPLAKDPETAAYALREMAIEFRLARKSGYEATPEELAEKVQARYFKSLYSAVQHMSGADLVNFLGKDLTKKLRAYDLEQLRGPAQKDDWAPERNKVQGKPSGKQEAIDPGDYRQKLRDQY